MHVKEICIYLPFRILQLCHINHNDLTVDNIPSKGNNATGIRDVIANGNTEDIQ